MKNFFRRMPEIEEFEKRYGRKEPILRWIPTLLVCVLCAVFSMAPAALLFVAINTWSPLKVPLWVLLLLCLFAMTLWIEFQNDIDSRRAILRAICNTLTYPVIAYLVRYFLSTDLTDRVLSDGSVARHSGIVPFWAALLLTWIFLTYGEGRWAEAKESISESRSS